MTTQEPKLYRLAIHDQRKDPQQDALNQLLATTYAAETFQEDEKEHGPAKDLEEKRSRLRDILDAATNEDIKILDKEAPEYVKLILAEIRERFEREFPTTLKGVWENTDGRGYYQIDQTQRIIDDITHDLDLILRKADIETIEAKYQQLQELAEKAKQQ